MYSFAQFGLKILLFAFCPASFPRRFDGELDVAAAMQRQCDGNRLDVGKFFERETEITAA